MEKLASNEENNTFGGSDIISCLTENSSLFIFAYSPQLKSLISWSNNAEKILGVKDLAVARDGNLFLRHVHPDDRFLLLTDLEHALKGHNNYRATYRWIRPDTNEVRWLHCRAALVESQKQSVDDPYHQLFEGVIIDLSDEFTGPIGRLAGPDSVSTILDAFPTLVFTLDRDLRILRINRARNAQDFHFGDAEFKTSDFRIGRPMLTCFSHPESRSHYQSTMLQILEGKRSRYRTRVFEEDTVYSLEITPLVEHGNIEGLLCIVSDISEIVHLERQLSDLQKTEGLRLLAAGVAHHFNNALQSIIGQAAVINNHPDKPELVAQASKAIVEVVKRVSDLTRQLYVLDDSKENLVAVDMNLTAMIALNRIENIFSLGTKIAVAFGSPAPVMARHEKLVEAIEAIIRNGIEHLKGEGTLSLRTYQVYLQDFEIQDLKSGSYAKLSISDSGGGMEAETRKRCLEPFFTTKERDIDTGVSHKVAGLGLSKAFAVVREFGGTITVESHPGLGTTIVMYLPVSQEAVVQEKTVAPVAGNAPQILIIDDDLMVLQTVSSMIQDLGYKCATAEDSRRGLALAKESSKTLQLVLLDAIMPGMDGAMVLRKLKKLRKDLKVIGFSGAPPEHTRPLLEAGALTILRKPVDPKTLSEAIRQALGESRKAA